MTGRPSGLGGITNGPRRQEQGYGIVRGDRQEDLMKLSLVLDGKELNIVLSQPQSQNMI